MFRCTLAIYEATCCERKDISKWGSVPVTIRTFGNRKQNFLIFYIFTFILFTNWIDYAIYYALTQIDKHDKRPLHAFNFLAWVCISKIGLIISAKFTITITLFRATQAFLNKFLYWEIGAWFTINVCQINQKCVEKWLIMINFLILIYFSKIDFLSSISKKC